MKKSILYPSKRMINRFSWHKQHGDFAEQHLLRKYFPLLNLKFRKIRKDKIGKKPDGWIIENNKKIALAEIKLIKYKQLKTGIVQKINTPKTIERAINYSKNQLKNINTELPKITYLLGDEIFFNETSIRWAIFGPEILKEKNGKVIYRGPKGLVEKRYNLFRDDILSAVICYILTTNGYEIWVFKNSTSKELPKKLFDLNNLKIFYNYDGSSLKKTINY